jgi:hypothetical protein
MAKSGLPKGTRRDLEKRIFQAQQALAHEVTNKILEEVKAKIPTGGWYTIYRRSLTYFANAAGDWWAVAGLWPVPLTEFPGDATLVLLEGKDPITVTLQGWNPWPMDQIPALAGDGIPGTAIARPASQTDVEKRREAILGVKKDIDEALSKIGAQRVEGTLPVIAGKTYADIVYMAKALEHGLAGLQRIPHWVAAFRKATSKVGAWTAGAAPRIRAILDGEQTFDRDAVTMPKGLEDLLRDR